MSRDTVKRFLKKRLYLPSTTAKHQDPIAYADGLQRWQILLTLWVCGLIELYFGDETGFTQQPYIPYGWQKRHQPLQLFARTTTKRLNLLGLLRLDNHLTVYHSEKSLTGAFVVDSLAHFVNQSHEKPVVIVLDNGWFATAAYPPLSGRL